MNLKVKKIKKRNKKEVKKNWHLKVVFFFFFLLQDIKNWEVSCVNFSF